MDSYTGTIERILYENPANAFKIAIVLQDNGHTVKIKGQIPDLREGESVVVSGHLEPDQRSDGVILQVKECERRMPETAEGALIFLKSGLIKGIGPVLAGEMVKRFGLDVFRILSEEPDRITEVAGIGEIKKATILESWGKYKHLHELVVFLQKFDISLQKAQQIDKFYGPDALKKLQENPYILAEDIKGISFNSIDKMALQRGFDKEHPGRIRAGILYCMNEFSSQGHCCIPLVNLVEKATFMMNVSKAILKPTIVDLRAKEDIVLQATSMSHNPFVYLKPLYDAEVEVSQRLLKLRDSEFTLPKPDASFLESIKIMEKETGMDLSDEQRMGVLKAASQRLFILTGGPGTGKCLGIDTPVMLFDGTVKPVQDIVAGDQLMGPDSKPRLVQSTSQGFGNLYRIHPTKGEPWVCNEDHVMTVRENVTKTTWDAPLTEWLQPKKSRKHYKAKLFRVPLNFPEQSLPLDPYLVGLWLGDGNTQDPRIHYVDAEIGDYLKQTIKDLGLTEKVRPEKRYEMWSVSLTQDRPGPRKNYIRDVFRSCLKDGEKSIAREYLINSRENRLQLLAGLIDTDGFLAGTATYEILTKSTALKEDIMFLARSLGFLVTAKYVKKTIKSLDFEGMYWRVFISGNIDQVPVKVPRRKSPPRRQIKHPLNMGLKIEAFGEGDYYGFTLDGDGRFLLGDFTVTHNTTVSNFIVKYFQQANKKIALASPTGKAAQRLAEVTGMEASTLHKLLKFNFLEKSFSFNEQYPLNIDVLLIDEFSMVDIALFKHVLRAVPAHAQIILVGDTDQLPSIQPGNLLHDFIQSGVFSVVTLKKIFRQAEKSLIIRNAHAINRGQQLTFPEFNKTEVNNGTDFFFIERNGAEAINDTVTKLFAKILPGLQYDPDEIQILSPMKRYENGVWALNKIMQGEVNPPDPKKLEITLMGNLFREGDRVIQTKNNYFHEVFNGNVGMLTSIDMEEQKLEVEFDDKVIEYSFSEADELKLAYALTIHKSQGSQYSAVVIPISNQHTPMLYKNLIYTAITRAKQIVIIVGDRKSLNKAISTEDKKQRYSCLLSRLQFKPDSQPKPENLTKASYQAFLQKKR